MADPSSLLPPEDPARVQARLAGILEVALDCIVTVDHEGRFIDFNPAAERTFGYTKAEVMGRDMADLIIPPTLRARHREGMARLLTGQAPHMLGRRIEISAIRRDGTEFPIELAITRIDLGRDVPPVYAAHLRDITDRRETESALISLQTQLEDRIAARTAALRASEASLRDSQELFSKSFAASPALMSIARLPGGGLIEVNEAFLRSVGRTREEVIGKTSRELGLWVDPVQREIFLGKLLDARVVRDFEAELKNEAGERRTMLLNADLIDSANGPAVLTVAIDISERRRRELAEAALARAEASYRSIFENALEGLYQTSPNGQFIRANPALARMFGYDSPDELITSINDIGRSLYVEPGRREQFFKLLGQHDQVTDFESEVFRRDGSRLWVSESVHAVRDPHGQLLFLEGIAIDITAQREAAAALAEAKEAADAANRAKSHFLASMSHELRTPLNGILGYTQILSRDPTLGPSQQRGIDVIHQSAEHLLELINDVLDLSKVEAGRLDLNPAVCDLPALLTGVAEMLGPRANAKGLGFATAFAPDLPRLVTIDEGRLRQVLLNLLSNALKFTRAGSVLLSAQAVPTDRSDQVRVTFSVSDTGAGIAPQDVPKLFQPFVQVGEAGRHAEGTGLGLAISRSIVAVLGGQLQVESTPGWGSRFWFELTLPATVSGPTAPATAPRRVNGYQGPRRHLLIVDDQATNREILEALLRSVGFEVVSVASAEAGLAACAQRLPDAVLMDLRMPGMSGLEASRLLRDRYGRQVRILAVSASAYDLDRQACLAAGCDDFLPKPVQADALWHSLGQLLGLTWTHEDASAAARVTIAPFASVTESPPDEYVRSIHDLARAGDVVGLRQRVEELAAKHPAHHEFARAVLDLAANFKLKAIRQLVAPWMNEKEKN